MRLFRFGTFGLLVQGAGLAAFIVVSRSSIAVLGKPAVIILTGLAVCMLLWEGVRRSKQMLAACLLPLTLALGYDVAFYLLGLLRFPGLLSGAKELSLDYLLSLLYVTGTLFALYSVATVLFLAINRGVRKIRLNTN